MFPGQGAQSVGMGADLYKNFDLVKKIFKTYNTPTAYFDFNGDKVQSGQREGSVQSLFSKSALALTLTNIDINKL